MTSILFLLAFILTAAFAAYRLITKSDQPRLNSYLRLGALAAFLLLSLLSVLQWSFRWYGLAALLLIWAILAAVSLLRNKPESAKFRPAASIFKAVGTLVLVGLVLIPAVIFPQSKLPPATGPHPVETVKYSYTDPARVETFSPTGGNREVNVQFWYPGDAGASTKFPLIVFSHGAFGMKASNTSTFMDLASNGYVVVSIDHPYHSLFTTDSAGHTVTVDPAFLQEVSGANNAKYTEEENYNLSLKWLALRTADIQFVLDTVLKQASDPAAEAVYHLIDPAKIGLMGHSLGGAAAVQVTRERDDIDAVVNLDADLLGEYLSYADGKYVLNQTPFPAPILTIFSDDLTTRMDKIPNAEEIVAAKHIKALAPAAYEIHLAGTNHMSLTDLAVISPLAVSYINQSMNIGGGPEADAFEIIATMNSNILSFFNATLKGQGAFAP